MGKISARTAATAITGEETFGIIQTTDKKSTIKLIFTYISSILSSISGNTRGTNAVDFQFSRASVDQVASANYSFIAGGRNNKIADNVNRGGLAMEGHAEGISNIVADWHGHGEGSHCLVDGKIAHAEGNTVICSANDSHAEGNRTVAGRQYFYPITYGSEDAGDDLGVKQFVLIPATYGDKTSYFPNLLTDELTTRYGAGSQMDDKGNIYADGYTPAVWDGETLTTANDLKWALHSQCILRGPEEIDITYVDILKSTYSVETGTKVYYDGNIPYASILGIYSSYTAVMLGGGNGQHSEGVFTSTWGYGAHSEGKYCNAWDDCTHAEGYQTKALAPDAHSEGLLTTASGDDSHSQGYFTKATAKAAHSEGYQTEANAEAAHAQGRQTIAQGKSSFASGFQSKALRDYQESYSSIYKALIGDNQVIRIAYSAYFSNTGPHILILLDDCEDGKAYNFETMVMGRQAGGIGGMIGDTFAYKFTGLVKRSGSTYTVIGTPSRILVGRDEGMAGDGLTTGVRVSWKIPNNTDDRLELQFDSIINTIFWVQTYSNIQEIL